MSRKVNWMLLLVTGLWISCTTNVELNQSGYQPQIVVDGTIESDGLANVYVTMSSPFLSEYDSASIQETFLNQAKVTLTRVAVDSTINDVDPANLGPASEVLTLYGDKNFFPPYVFQSTAMFGVEGGTYRLDVEAFGKTLTATTTIPKAPVVTNAYLDAITDTSGYLKATVKSLYSEPQWFFTQVRSQKLDHYFHPSQISLFSVKPPLEQELTLYRSKETNLKTLLKNEKGPYSGWNYYVYDLTDVIFLKIGTVDETSYQILESLFVDGLSMQNPFAFNAAGVQTNIVGGIGRWVGIGMAPVRIVRKK